MPFEPPSPTLPRWVAAFDIDATGRTAPERTAPERVGGRTADEWPLQVIEPTAGCQLAHFGAAGRSTVLFDGYLLDRDEMLDELGADRDVSSEAELVALAFERWGEALFERLHGRFLLAIWDSRARTFFLTHDACGHHPVFLCRQGSRVCFSSNVLALAQSGLIERRPNRIAFAMMIRMSRPPAGQTFFAGIERLAPGRLLRWSAGEREEIRFWEPYPGDDAAYLSEEEAQRQFERSFERAVGQRLALGADGIMLSGGLDSCCVAAVAADEALRGEAPMLTAWAMRGHAEDQAPYEEEMQARVAEHLGLPLVTTSWYECLGDVDLVTASLEAMSRLPVPTCNFWTGGYIAVKERAAAEGVRRFLTGSGGDEWFSVDPFYAADLVRGLRLGRLLQLIWLDSSGGWRQKVTAARRYGWTSGLRSLLASSWMSLSPRSMGSFLEHRARKKVPSDTYPDAELTREVRRIVAQRLREGVNPRGRFPRRFHREVPGGWSDSFMVFDREFEYHASRASGILTLSPFHDRRLAELASHVPPQMAMRRGRNKGLLRRVAEKRLTGLGFERYSKSHGSEDDYHFKLLRRRLPECFETIGVERLEELGLVERSGVMARLGDCARMELRDLMQLFGLLSAETWLGAHME